MVLVVQLYEYTENTVYFQMVKCMVYKLYLNKTFIFKKEMRHYKVEAPLTISPT